MSEERSEKSQQDYARLDDAIQTLCDWEVDILVELNRRNRSDDYLHAVIDAMRRIHSPDLDD